MPARRVLLPVVPFDPPRALEAGFPSAFAGGEIKARMCYSKMLSEEPGFVVTFLCCTNLLLDLSPALGDRLREEEMEAQRGYGPCPRSHRQYEADAAFPASPRIRLLKKKVISLAVILTNCPLPSTQLALWFLLQGYGASLPGSEEIKHRKLNKKIYSHILMKT